MIVAGVIIAIVLCIEVILLVAQREMLRPMNQEELDNLNFFRLLNGKKPESR